jgi:hypothetical protein
MALMFFSCDHIITIIDTQVCIVGEHTPTPLREPKHKRI